MRRTIFALALTAALPLAAQQTPAPQLRTPRASQKQVMTQTVGFTDITITYSRPGVKGRQIWGALVPYDKVWRSGANEATTIAFSDDVTINGQPLPKGTYSLHTIPGKDEWTIVFNNTANQWGSFNYDPAKDALRVKAKPQTASFSELLTYEVPQVTPDQATVAIHWENLSVPFTVGTNSTQKALADARAAVAAAKPDDWQTPLRAATFAIENSVDLDEANRWLDQSIKANENIRNLFEKARAQAMAGDRAGAIVTAQKAISKAGEKDKDEVGEIQHSIASWQGPASSR
ncbi:MAG: DUF2911 domain-containing protein [Acidobacteriota bacterium]|nr:DUF2911 domain-containing protein [Acidobacteriota bacterium]